MGEVIDLPRRSPPDEPPNPGNGARGSIERFCAARGLSAPDPTMPLVDLLLIALWIDGFKVVPLGEDGDP